AEFSWPNGLGFSPDSSKLYMTIASPPNTEDPGWYVYDVGEDGALANKRLFFDPGPLMKV
ncbi:unnamed protein product, partial [Hapterophycus canaliculatus]